MGVRLKKYFKQCKEIDCTGKRSKQCPEIPTRQNGQYKTCSAWAVEFRTDGKWVSLIYPDVRSRSSAERRLSLVITDRERGVLNLPTRKAIPTLAEYCKAYLELHKGDKENTLLGKERAVNALTKQLGEYRLDKLTSFVIEKYRLERKEKDGVKDSSINVDISILSHILNTAVKAGIIDKNPCREVKRLRVTQVKDRVLSSQEIALLLNKLEGKDRVMILTGLFTGMRLNEVIGLKWHDIDFGKGLITFTQGKTGKLVTVPLSSCLADELMRYKQGVAIGNTKDAGRSECLFEDKAITKKLIVGYSSHFGKLFKELGIDRFTFHNLRHSFASLQGDLGTGAITVKEMLGHSDLSMTLRYSHAGLDGKKRAIEAFTNHILGVGSKPVIHNVSQTGTI